MTFVVGKAKQQQQADGATILGFIEDVEGELARIEGDLTDIDNGLALNAADRAAIGTATAAQVRDIVGRMLNRENALLQDYKHEKQVSDRLLRALRWLARRLL